MDWVLFLALMCLLCMGGMAVMMFAGGGRGMWWGHVHDHHLSGRDDGIETAREVLDRRYANGEITEERYRAMRLDVDNAAERR